MAKERREDYIPPTAMTFAGDPALIKAQGSLAQALAFAEADALRQTRDLLLDYGDPSLTQRYLGETPGGLNTLATAKNPFSQIKLMQQGYETAGRDLGESLNKANLWYSGHRQRSVGNLGRAYEQQKYGAARDVQMQLGAIQSALLQARMNAVDNRREATNMANQARLAVLLGRA